MPLVRQAEYARHRGISREAVRQRTVPAGGPIPVHGPKKLIDVAEADALWEGTMSAQGFGSAQARAAERDHQGGATWAPAAAGVSAAALYQARAAALVVDVQTKRLILEQRRGALISRDRVVVKAAAFARLLADRWCAWPARVGPALAATFGVDAAAFVAALQPLVEEQLAQLARERCEV